MRVGVTASLNQTNKKGTVELGDRLKDPAARQLDEEIIKRQKCEKVMGLLGDSLSPRENEILFRRFLIDPDEPQTLEEVGKVLKLTRERIRQIEKKALEKLRSKANNAGLYSLDDF